MTSSAPLKSYPLIRRLTPKSWQPALRGLRKRWLRRQMGLKNPYWSVYPYTHVSAAKQQNLVRLATLVEDRGVDGAAVECGVLDGGCSALMAHATAASGRPVHMFDSWEGLPATTDGDDDDSSRWVGECVGSPARVMAIMKQLQVDSGRLEFHRGWFKDTFPVVDIPSIALLHIDCDFYEPTKDCLERWVKHLAPGGAIQIDDYDVFQGSRQATDEFLAENSHLGLRLEESGGGAFFIENPVAR